MNWNIPNWWEFLLLALASYRIWRLVAEDVVLDPIRDRIVKTSKVSEFVACPFCLGFWIAVVVWLVWTAWPHWALIITVPFAISGLLALIAVNLEPE